MLQRMSLDHIDDVAEIHNSSWGRNEISVKLGEEYIKRFYENVVQSPFSFGFVFLVDKIIGYATGFSDYQGFNEYFKRKNFWNLWKILLWGMACGKMGFADLINLLNDGKKFKKSTYSKYHLGALALSNFYKGKPIGRQAITEVIGAVLIELENKGASGCSLTCDILNEPMRKLIQELGFDEINVIKMVGRSVVLYEKNFRSNVSAITKKR